MVWTWLYYTYYDDALVLTIKLKSLETSYDTLLIFSFSGSGLVSNDRHYYGFFSAAIKLPAGLSSGVVVAFYVSFTS